MKTAPRVAPWTMLALAAVLAAAGCKGNQDASADTQNMSQDPADQNTAQATDASYTATPATSSAPATSAAPAARPAPAPAPAAQTMPASYEPTPEETGEQPVAQAPQPPPQLPEYSQPECPGEGYIWTPGYWNYQPTGYYWVPGVWTRAPYMGALWTPPYWGFFRGVYVLFPGHWGQHIGYYGGVNYGYGYTGYGYHGGYWNGDRFNYNRTVNNVNTTIIKNVYTYNVVNVNKTTVINRVSYNGGPGGLPNRPRPEEVVTVREPRAPVMRSQVEHEQNYRADHNQFEPVNHGRPATPVIGRPIEADRDVHPVVRPIPVARPEEHGRPEVHPVPSGHVARPGEHPPQHKPEEKHK